MPEFRFRRKKKHSSRRHTLHDPEEAHAQVVAAKEMVKREVSGRREGVREEGGRGEGGRG